MRKDLGKEKTSANIYEDAYIHKGRQKYIYKKNPPAINLDIGSLHIWKYKSLYISVVPLSVAGHPVPQLV